MRIRSRIVSIFFLFLVKVLIHAKSLTSIEETSNGSLSITTVNTVQPILINGVPFSPKDSQTQVNDLVSKMASLTFAVCKWAQAITLDCTISSSREAVMMINTLCPRIIIGKIDRCCCEEAYLVNEVMRDIFVTSEISSLEFENLEIVGGSITARGGWNMPGHIQTVRLGRLRRIGRDLNLQRNKISILDFGHLQEVAGTIDLAFNDLSHVDFCQITNVGSIVVHDNFLFSINFGNIQRVSGGIFLQNNLLTSMRFGQITHIGDQVFLFNNQLSEISFAHVVYIGRGVSLHDNMLTEISFGNITFVGLTINLRNNRLSRIDFGELRHIGFNLELDQNELMSIEFPQNLYIEARAVLLRNPIYFVDCQGGDVAVLLDTNVPCRNCTSCQYFI
eukprot:gene3777-6299_t